MRKSNRSSKPFIAQRYWPGSQVLISWISNTAMAIWVMNFLALTLARGDMADLSMAVRVSYERLYRGFVPSPRACISECDCQRSTAFHFIVTTGTVAAANLLGALQKTTRTCYLIAGGLV